MTNNNSMSESPKTKRRRIETAEHIQTYGIVKKRTDTNPHVKHACNEIVKNILSYNYSTEHIQLINDELKNIINTPDLSVEQYLYKCEQLIQTLIKDVQKNERL